MKPTKAIITAMTEEAEIIIKKFNLKEEKKINNLKIYTGDRKSDEGEEKIVLILAGIGKIQATIATTYLLENYIVDKIINIGIAGNLAGKEDIKVGDVFLPNTFIQHDIYLPFDGEHLNYATKPIFLETNIGENYDLTKFGLLLNGVCLTGDQFIDNEEKLIDLRTEFGGDVCEMEAFAILSVAREYDVLHKCVVIKAISDGADNEAKSAHMDNLEFAMENSVAVLEIVL